MVLAVITLNTRIPSKESHISRRPWLVAMASQIRSPGVEVHPLVYRFLAATRPLPPEAARQIVFGRRLTRRRADSIGGCNSPGEDFAWFHPSEGLSRATIELSSDGIEVIL